MGKRVCRRPAAAEPSRRDGPVRLAQRQTEPVASTSGLRGLSGYQITRGQQVHGTRMVVFDAVPQTRFELLLCVLQPLIYIAPWNINKHVIPPQKNVDIAEPEFTELLDNLGFGDKTH